MDNSDDFMRPIDNTSVVQRVIDRLTKAMINKNLRVGDKVPTEIELANSFGVGRNSVREAIKILAAFGVLEVRRPEGTFVTTKFSDKMLDPLLYGIILDESNSIESLKALREWIDWGILRLATVKADDSDIVALESCFADLESALNGSDIKKIFDADNNFHIALNKAAHNSLFSKIAELIRTLTSEIRLRTIKSMAELGRLAEMKAAHEAFLDAIKYHTSNIPLNLVVDSYFYDYDVLNWMREDFHASLGGGMNRAFL